MNTEVTNIVKEIESLIAKNFAITKACGFFTAEQIANEKKSWALINRLRFDYGIEWKFKKSA